MVELGHASVANRTMFGSDRPLHKTRRTKESGLKRGQFERHIDHILDPVLFGRHDHTGVAFPSLQKAIPQRSGAQQKGHSGRGVHHRHDEYEPRYVEPQLRR